jgi:hypothetical protein
VLLGLVIYEPRQFANFVKISRKVSANQAGGLAVFRIEGSVPLKRFLLIFSALIFDSRVVPGTPSLAAAPEGPDARPRHSRKDLNQGFLLSRTPVQEARLYIRDTGRTGQTLPREPTSIH